MKNGSGTYGWALALLFLWAAFSGFAQADSLKRLLSTATHDTTRCRVLNLMIESENNDLVWPKYNDQIEAIADRNLKDPGPLKEDFLRYKAIVFNNRGYLAFYQGKNDEAVQLYESALEIQRKIGDKKGMAATLYNLGDSYMNQGHVSKALENLLTSLDLHEQVKDSAGTAYVLNDLGWQYYLQGEHANAEMYLEKALLFRQRLNDNRGLANTYNTLGLIAMGKKDYPKAKEHFHKTLELMKEIGDQQGLGLALNSLGSVYQWYSDLPNALKHYQEAAAIQLTLGDKNGWITSTTNASSVIFEMARGDRRQIDRALQLCQQSLEEAQKMGFPSEIRSAAYTLKRIYLHKGDHEKALEYYQLEVKMRDSISNAETRRASVKKQFQYEYEKKAAADSIRNLEAQKVTDAQLSAQQAQLKKEKTQRYVLYGGLLLAGVFVLVVFNRFRVTKMQKAVIEAQKKEVDEAYASLHEKNKEVMDSIYYARRIQKALVTSEKYVERTLSRLHKG